MRKLLFFYVALPAIATGAISIVQARPSTASTVCANNGATATQNCSFAVPPTAGNAVWVLIAGPTGTMGVTDNQTGTPNIYTQQATGVDSTGNRTARWFAAVNITVNTATFTITANFPTGYASVNLVEVSGQANSSFMDVAGGSTANGLTSPLACGGLATTNANDLILAGFNSPNFSGTMGMSAGSPDSTAYTLQSIQSNSGCC